jgi:hypothetical protein
LWMFSILGFSGRAELHVGDLLGGGVDDCKY